MISPYLLPPTDLIEPFSRQDVPFGFASLARLPILLQIYLIANGALARGIDLLETILVLQSSCPLVDFECGSPCTFNAQNELTCKLEWKWCVREKGRDGETMSCRREHGYFDEETISGPAGMPLVERTKTSLKLRLLKLSKRWRRGVKEPENATGSHGGTEPPPPYTAWKRQRSEVNGILSAGGESKVPSRVEVGLRIQVDRKSVV